MVLTTLAFFAVTISLVLSKCPKEEVIRPCYCGFNSFFGGDVITCGGADKINLKDIFKRLSKNSILINKRFKGLRIVNAAITEIEAQTTADIKFDEIDIDAPSLKKIHQDAFHGTFTNVLVFEVSSDNKNLETFPNPYNLFDLMSSFKYVERIVFQPPKVTWIPTNQFKTLRNLSYLQIGAASQLPAKTSLSISDDAFYNLKALDHLVLESNRMVRISQKALRFPNDPDQLTVDLGENDLTTASFERGSLVQFNRPTKLDIRNNNFTFLNEDIFKPFLDTHVDNEINDLSGNRINCSDCKNFWMIKGQQKYKDKVKLAYCNGDQSKELFAHNWTRIGCK